MTLARILGKPTPKTLPFKDVEGLLCGLGCTVVEGDESRVHFLLNGQVWYTHRPHPGRDALQYQIRGVRDFPIETGIES
jgi:hypothetical protein